MNAWVKPLIAWFERGHRPMPWRHRPTPYAVWVSEVMLQQTQVAAVIPYFRRFLRRFPSLAALARAPLGDVLKAWQGLGYYARARHLHAAARRVRQRHAGRLPRTHAALRALPGIGDYTAAAVASIAFGEPVPAVDGNVRRVGARLWAEADGGRPGAAPAALAARLRAAIPADKASSFNQALMELGALVCKPRRPRCQVCPIRRHCAAWRRHRDAVPPAIVAERRIPLVRAAVAVVWRGRRVLLAQRRPDQMLGGLWEFPGGKPRRGEWLADAARRETAEETGLRIKVGQRYGVVRHAYSHFRVQLTAFRCTAAPGRARARAAARVRWVPVDHVARYPLPRATEKILALIGSALYLVFSVSPWQF